MFYFKKKKNKTKNQIYTTSLPPEISNPFDVKAISYGSLVQIGKKKKKKKKTRQSGVFSAAMVATNDLVATFR
jgi:hypothetical protein